MYVLWWTSCISAVLGIDVSNEIDTYVSGLHAEKW